MGLWLFGGFYKFRIRLLWRTTLDIHDTQWSTNLPRCSFFYNSTKSCMIFLTLSQQVKKTKYSMDRNTKRDRRRRRTKRENEHVPWKNLVLLSSMALRPVYHFPQKVGFLIWFSLFEQQHFLICITKTLFVACVSVFGTFSSYLD